MDSKDATLLHELVIAIAQSHQIQMGLHYITK